MSEETVRFAEGADLPQLTELYNYYIRDTPITFDVEPMTVQERGEWMGHYSAQGPHRLLVAVRDSRVLGYASSSQVRPKAAYLTSVETSIYCLPGETGRGLGRRLYQALFDALQGEDLHRAYAGVTLPNAASVGFHQAFGFREVGTFSEMGRKFGRYWDVLWMERHLNGAPSAPLQRER